MQKIQAGVTPAAVSRIIVAILVMGTSLDVTKDGTMDVMSITEGMIVVGLQPRHSRIPWGSMAVTTGIIVGFTVTGYTLALEAVATLEEAVTVEYVVRGSCG